MQIRLKHLGKVLLCKILELQVRRLRKLKQFTIVAVVGSVGKTSTKLAIARAIGVNARVIYQEGNYNDRLTVPLVLFGQTEPAIFNVVAWTKILLSNERRLRLFRYDYAVLELGTDGPGQLAEFSYLQPEILVVTAIAAEHMEYFGTLDAVALEELGLLVVAKQTLINIDDVASKYLHGLKYLSYSLSSSADYRIIKREQHQLVDQTIFLRMRDGQQLSARICLQAEQGAKSALAAAAVVDLLGWRSHTIIDGLEAIQPVAGRMQVLAGINNATLIDDTYNASPIAVRAALDTLYCVEATQRIAVLGTMNELGDTSAEDHANIGRYCNPDKLDIVITIGKIARDHLAPAAEAVGCTVKSFLSPYEAGHYIKHNLIEGSVVLAKGSQNGVFSEEALKPLLLNKHDIQKLVRQSDYWLSIKLKQFPEQ